LHQAAEQGNVNDLQQHIDAKADINHGDTAGMTPLHLAAEHGHVEAVRFLIENGARPGMRTDERVAPLHLATSGGHETVVGVLLDAGADPDASESTGNTPLHYATKANQLAVANRLLSVGASREMRNDSGAKPLTIAVRNGYLSLVELLAGENPNMHRESYLLLDADDPETLQWLIKHGADPQATISGESVLHHASVKGSPAKVKALLVAGANLDSKSYDGETPLHRAVCYGGIDVIGVLLDAGANIAAKGHRGATPLHRVFIAAPGPAEGFVARRRRERVGRSGTSHQRVELLIATGADPTATDSFGDTPLHYCASAGSGGEVMELLLVSSAEAIDARNRASETPLHLAARHGGVDVVQSLIRNGADLDVQDGRGRTALDIATEQLAAAERDIRNGAYRRGLAEAVSTSGWRRVAELLRDAGAK